MDVIARMDGLNRHRFADEPELLAAWKSATDVVGPVTRRNGKSVAGTEGSDSTPTPPGTTSGEVQASA